METSVRCAELWASFFGAVSLLGSGSDGNMLNATPTSSRRPLWEVS